MSGKFENLNCCLMKRNEPDHDRCNMVPPIMLFRLRAQGRPPFGRITTIARLIAAMWYRRRRAAARREPADPVRRKSSTPRVQMLRVGPLSNRRACDIKLSKTTPSALLIYVHFSIGHHRASESSSFGYCSREEPIQLMPLAQNVGNISGFAYDLASLR